MFKNILTFFFVYCVTATLPHISIELFSLSFPFEIRKFPLEIWFYLPLLFECVTCVAVVIVVLVRYCSFPYAFFLLFSLCSFLFRVFSGRKQKQSYVHNNLRFSLCLRCYLHVQTTAFSGENMHENRKESLLCIFFFLSFLISFSSSSLVVNAESVLCCARARERAYFDQCAMCDVHSMQCHNVSLVKII